jgi:hypothetical protein
LSKVKRLLRVVERFYFFSSAKYSINNAKASVIIIDASKDEQEKK